MWKLLQVVLLALLVWTVYVHLGRITWLLPLALLSVSLLNVLTVWMLRSRPGSIGPYSHRPFAKEYLRVVCFFSGDQLPTSHRASGMSDRCLLQSSKDVPAACIRAKQVICGYDDIVDDIFARTFENHVLSKGRKGTSWKGPLASFLLVGGEGTGKRLLARVLAKLLFQDGRIESFDCAQLSAEILLGTTSSNGGLIGAIRHHPHSLVLFEHVDRCKPEILRILTQLLSTGSLRDPRRDQDVSFSGTLIVFTTTRETEMLGDLEKQGHVESVWQQRAAEILGDKLALDNKLLGALTAIFLVDAPSDHVKAAVAALLMIQECQAHGIELTNVDAEILAIQAIQCDETSGFSLMPQQIQRLLRKPLLAASDQGQGLLSLRVHRHEGVSLTLSHYESTER